MKKTYLLVKEFLPLVHISNSTFKRRKDEILDWWAEQFDYELGKQGKTVTITVDLEYNFINYKRLPRNTKAWEEKQAEKMKDYEDFIKKSIPAEGKLTSKVREARLAISEFGLDKYGHYNDETVSRRYTGPAMEKLCTKSSKGAWVNYETYEPLPEDVVKIWREILKKNYIDEERAANAWYRERNGEDTTTEKNAYKAAMEEFKNVIKCNAPIYVAEWNADAAAVSE